MWIKSYQDQPFIILIPVAPKVAVKVLNFIFLILAEPVHNLGSALFICFKSGLLLRSVWIVILFIQLMNGGSCILCLDGIIGCTGFCNFRGKPVDCRDLFTNEIYVKVFGCYKYLVLWIVQCIQEQCISLKGFFAQGWWW